MPPLVEEDGVVGPGDGQGVLIDEYERFLLHHGEDHVGRAIRRVEYALRRAMEIRVHFGMGCAFTSCERLLHSDS